MASQEQVRIWRPADRDDVLLMAGRTSEYAIEPRGEYVFGIVGAAAMRSRRGRERRLVRPGELVAWDPTRAHAGTAAEGRPWSSRLMIVALAGLDEPAGEGDSPLPAGAVFPRPVIFDPPLASSFLALHVALERPATRLERDERLATWLRSVVARHSTARPRRPARGGREERAFRAARDYLGEFPERNVGLDELAAAAGIGKFRLLRVFRERTGLPPHALQVAHRLRRARRLLEAGEPIAEVAAATGFADQSHLHRHFRRSLGMTPGEYCSRFQTPGSADVGSRLPA